MATEQKEDGGGRLELSLVDARPGAGARDDLGLGLPRRGTPSAACHCPGTKVLQPKLMRAKFCHRRLERKFAQIKQLAQFGACYRPFLATWSHCTSTTPG